MIIDFNIIDFPFKVDSVQVNDYGIFVTTNVANIVVAHKYLNENTDFNWFVDIDHEQQQTTLFTHTDIKDGEIWI